MSGAQQLLAAGGGISGTLLCGTYTVGYSTLVGFNSTYSVGLISPTSFYGFPFLELDTGSLAGNLNLSLTGSAPNALFNTLTLAGTSFSAANAIYANSGTSTSWTWYGAASLLTANQFYNFSIS